VITAKSPGGEGRVARVGLQGTKETNEKLTIETPWEGGKKRNKAGFMARETNDEEDKEKGA